MSANIPPEGGVLGLLKPPGMTSHDVVHACRSLLGTRNVGHTGTLDPLAAGVLPLVFGPATRLSEQLAWPAKVYRAEAVFGIRTDSGDLEGQVVAEDDSEATEITLDLVRAAGERLVGRRLQVPSPFSARKVNGRRLYQLARRGRVRERHLREAAREIEVYSVRVLGSGPLSWGKHAARPAALLEFVCSGGTYVRQLVEELAAGLGTVACLSFLVRTACAGIRAADCVTLDDVAMPSAALPYDRFGCAWRRPAQAVGFLPVVVVGPNTARQVGHGVAITGRAGERRDPGFPVDASADGWLAIVDEAMRLVALARAEGGEGRDGGCLPRLQPRKVFQPC